MWLSGSGCLYNFICFGGFPINPIYIFMYIKSDQGRSALGGETEAYVNKSPNLIVVCQDFKF